MHQGGRQKWNEMAAKVSQLPNPRNLGRRVGMGASEEIVCWCLLEVVGGGEPPAGPHQWGKVGNSEEQDPA